MRRHVHGARAAVGTVARTLVGLSVLASCASAVQAQCDYRSSLEPLESIEGLTPEQIQELRVLREAFAAAFERGDERNGALSREENQRIRDAVDGTTERIFFLRIFDGFMFRDYRGVRWVALYDDSEYLRIADFNLSLWEAMLDVWYEPGGRGNE